MVKGKRSANNDLVVSSTSLEEVTEMMKQLQERQTKFELLFSDSTGSNQKDPSITKKSISQLPNKQRLEMGEEVQAMRKILNKITSDVSSINKRVENCEKEIDELEQYSRRNCLVLHGNKTISQESSESKVYNYVLETLNGKFELDRKVTKYDIDIAHVLKTKSKNGCPIIIKFANRWLRNQIFWKKKTLAKTGLSITESLTRKRLTLLKMAQEKFGFHNVWTNNGTINAIHGDTKKVIINETDLIV